MTKEFVLHMINDENGLTNQQNKWISLSGLYQRIVLLSDRTIQINPIYNLFYFDTNAEMLLIRKLDGDLIQSNENVDGYINININNVSYIDKISEGGIEYGNLGKVHSCIPFDNLSIFCNSDISEQTAKSHLDEIRES